MSHLSGINGVFFFSTIIQKSGDSYKISTINNYEIMVKVKCFF